MNKLNRKTLPKGFRHLFSQREIRGLETQAGVSFTHISFGHITHAGSFQREEHLQSAIHAVSISGNQSAPGWDFSIYQSGFRAELLPTALEGETKEKVRRLISAYIHNVVASKETDFISRPQLWVYVRIIDNRAEIQTRILK